MKYNPEMSRSRSVDPHLLGHMLGNNSPIDADYTGTNCHTCASRDSRRNTRQSNNGSNIGCGCNNGCSNGCNENSMMHGDAALGSACEGEPSLAMAYSPFQHFHKLFPTDEALRRGTLFCELDKPWKVGGSR